MDHQVTARTAARRHAPAPPRRTSRPLRAVLCVAVLVTGCSAPPVEDLPGAHTPSPAPAPRATAAPASPASDAGRSTSAHDRAATIAQICAETELLHGWVGGGAADSQIGTSVDKISAFNLHAPGTDGLYYAAEVLAEAWRTHVEARDTELDDGGQAFLHAVEALRTQCTLG